MVRRFLEDRVLGCLKEFPVVLLTGARQVGKTTLVQSIASAKWPARYITLDSVTTLGAALRDPDGFLMENPPPLILDEVQRAPDLLRAIKLRVDRDRKPGQYLLTGSANLMTLRKVSETLAGRVALLNLYPFSWGEIKGCARPVTFDRLFSAKHLREFVSTARKKIPAEEYTELKKAILTGGYPVPSLMRSKSARAVWFDGYRQTYLERDVRDITQIENYPDFDRLLTLCAARTSQLLNYSSLSQDLGLPYTTLRRYLALLETTYQVFLLHPYFVNIGKRLIKSPKLHLTDTGMACHLTAIESWSALERQNRIGPLFETWVCSELLKLVTVSDPGIRLSFWRTTDRKEVDFLIERAGELIPFQVTWSRNVGARILSSLRSCTELLGDRIKFSLVLYPGDEALALGPTTGVIPVSSFFCP